MPSRCYLYKYRQKDWFFKTEFKEFWRFTLVSASGSEVLPLWGQDSRKGNGWQVFEGDSSSAQGGDDLGPHPPSAVSIALGLRGQDRTKCVHVTHSARTQVF